MHVITAYSHKGGTGKTTALMLLASAIDARGQRALLVDCDPHQSFRAYQVYSQEEGRGLWSDHLEVRFLPYETTSLADLEGALLDADDSGRFDYCLINLAGIDHPFNRHVLRYAELTLLPFAPAALDLMELPGALQVLRQLGEEGEIGEARVVLTRIKSRLTAAQRLYVGEVLDGFPHLVTQIRDTAISADLVMRGLLGPALQRADAEAKGLDRAEVSRLREALDMSLTLLSEIDQNILGGGAA
jgi:cellulose biosynthesis protein BcsQ